MVPKSLEHYVERKLSFNNNIYSHLGDLYLYKNFKGVCITLSNKINIVLELGQGVHVQLEELLDVNNIKSEDISEDGDELEGEGEEELEGETYSDEEDQEDQESSSDVDINGE